MADEHLGAELERLEAENEQLENQRGCSVSLEVSEKGGVDNEPRLKAKPE